MKRLIWASYALAVILIGACRTERITDKGCKDDSDCGNPASAFRCEVETGTCYCRTNEACQPREFCNAIGYCQDKAGCEKNSDCLDPSLLCDTTTGTCLPKGRCTLDLHCEFGKVCDTAKSQCVEGCRTNGDCNGSSCRCDAGPCVCNGTTPAELARCQLGVCDPNFCADKSFCQYGEMCGVIPDAGTPLSQCYSDYNERSRPYCDSCVFGGGLQTCGRGANYCLIDTANPGNYFCGADCSQGQSCPRGYACSDVIVVLTQWQCSRENPTCPVNRTKPCSASTPCPRGGQCVLEPGQDAGFCAPKCNIDENDNFGFCACLVDSDCVSETCTAGECSISRRSCTVDDDCRSIRCVDFKDSGGCLIGQNCAPSDGLTCLQVR